jgi:hypothetical protein
MERKIIIGLITSTEYIKQIRNEWSAAYIESQAAKILSSWCIEYFDKRGVAPLRNIETILINKLRKKKIKKELAEEIETDILGDLSEQYENQDNNLDGLLADTREYFIERQLEINNEEVQTALDKGDLQKAIQLRENFKLNRGDIDTSLDLADKDIDKKIEAAFASVENPVVKFDGALGEFWNSEMTKGSFVALLAPEKRGKTFMLLEFMMKAYEQNVPTAFFQAGDMTEAQQIVRTAIYLTQKSNKAKFCGKQYIPVLDCIKNQTDACNRRIRACQFGVFKEKTEEQIRNEITYEEILEAKKGNKFYKNCYNCINWQKNPWGAVWFEEFDNGNEPLTASEANRAWKKFFKNNNTIRLSTHANGELTISKMISILEGWKRQGFMPEQILVDYADLVEAGMIGDMRHLINHVWRGLRGMSQKYDSLIVAPTQADAKSYEQALLKLGNFSEDKRKLAHVTAMYGLNQDPDGREKKLGIMRVNKIVIREDGFHQTDQVHLLQRLQIGRPNLGSYF